MKKAAFVGTGLIGAGLAVNAVMHGYDVFMYYRRNFESLAERVRGILRIFTDNQVCSVRQAEEWFNSISFTMELSEAVDGAVIVQESIAESADMKREMYTQIQDICGDSPLIASSTSTLFPSSLSEGARYPERIVVGHPYNPAHLLPVIEICGGLSASESSVCQAKAIYTEWGKVPVVCLKEDTGFIVNNISWAAMEICHKKVVSGVCTAEDMDKAIIYGPGLRMAILGQILTISLGAEGGFRNIDAKYGRPFNPENEIMAQGVDEMMKNRLPVTGNSVETIEAYRDKMIIDILKLQNLI